MAISRLGRHLLIALGLGGVVSGITATAISFSPAGGAVASSKEVTYETKTCYSLFSSVADGGFMYVCPPPQEKDNPLFWLEWWGKEWQRRDMMQVKSITTSKQERKLTVTITPNNGTGTKEINMNIGGINTWDVILGFDSDKLTQLDNQDLSTICKFETATGGSHRPKLTCGDYKQELKVIKTIKIPQTQAK
ncbi:hypothetical protein OVS_03830 [Mycoplasma ovis str. Michigan]|uniref:Secreted protein n=1 Tax=Mycoplasma ovis str. Michigan TaxID=1415773 RepID=A0ABN4BM45_9MOLU|nr:hypothetical protein [Mycoplasma ovis]AHC40498.1 hypothetical protein OVS_03830 [Mycoplasma ovis str. Michigan]